MSQELVNYALDYARALNAKILLVHIIQTAQLGEILGSPETGTTVFIEPQMIQQMKNSAQAELEKCQKLIQEKGIMVETRILTGTPFLEITQFAEKEKADLIIIGSYGKSKLKHFLLGNVAEKVAKKSSIPVLIFKPAK